MEHNVGKYDKIIRLGIGGTLIFVALWGDLGAAWMKPVLFVIAAYLILTGAMGFCPLYKVCKISTHKISDKDMADLMKN